MCRELVDGVVLVNNAAISGAIRDVYAETRTVLEPAGALAVAGARAYLQRHGCQVTVRDACWPRPCACSLPGLRLLGCPCAGGA